MKSKLEMIEECKEKGYEELAQLAEFYDVDQIKQLMLGAQKNLDYKQYCSIDYPWDVMLEYRKMLELDIDITDIKKYKFSSWQLEELRLAIMEGKDITPILDSDMSYDEMHMWRVGVKLTDDEIEEYSREKVINYIRSKMPVKDDKLMLSFVKKFI